MRLFIVIAVLSLLIVGGISQLPRLAESATNTVLEQSWVAPNTAQKRLKQLQVADLHADTMLWERDLLTRSSYGHVDLPRLQDSNVALQVFAAVTKVPKGQNYQANDSSSDNLHWLVRAQLWPTATWDSLFERAQYQLDKLKAFADASNGQLRLIRKGSDVDELLADRSKGINATGAVFAIEGAHPLEGKLENLDILHQKGLRIIGLTHFFDNELGGSLHGQSNAGLTEFGYSVVARARQLGLIVDLAHASPQMVEDVLALPSMPLIISHGGIQSVCDKGRNLDDAVMQRFAAKGGLLGVGYWDAAICEVSPAGIAKAIRAGINLMGLEHIALGSDYDGGIEAPFDTSQLALIVDAMQQQQFSPAEIEAVMGKNTLKFLTKHLPN